MNSSADEPELVELVSSQAFGPTLDRVTWAVESMGLKVFTSIDHAAGAQAIGLALPPTTVLFYGRPEGGTPVMQAVPNAALDLPLRVLVREESPTRTIVVFRPIAATLARLGAAEALQHRLEPAQQVLVDILR